ncbi:hypothetical protein GW17_00038989 [Ensete ventricosum]|nr:hypothetical protein GW17_00038989 [Ensete ventricosum]RZS21951.1 hypothetical protein BHM03_00054663 [Ensete ventricosum]
MRRRLVPPLEDEATPHPCTGRRGFALLPRSLEGRRGIASFLCGEMLISMVSPDNG